MAVVNLGTLQAKEHPLTALSKGLSSGAELGMKLATLKATVGKLEAEKLEKVKKGIQDQMDHMDLSMSPQQIKVFSESDSGKEFMKSAKKLFPERFDEGGNYTPAQTKAVIAGQTARNLAEAVDAAKKGTANEQQINLLKLTKAFGKENVDDALEYATKNLPKNASDNQLGATIGRFLKRTLGGATGLGDALAQKQGFRQGLAETPGLISKALQKF